ncbi:MAG: BrnT family toxin [Pyrinomonadaceae bacterium]|jgi:uncharacterized DUF497 family protein|nr:BrnT family toxin [Blastocatellia bacterium]MDQ3219640.1 BrnT family toxin [Acidobacteriota bacterium]
MVSENDFSFDWDEDKAAANFKKHKVKFEEAKTIFGDPFSVTKNDPLHSVGEMRFVDIGRSVNGKILVVSYTQRGRKIRLISCRKATKAERMVYEEKEF